MGLLQLAWKNIHGNAFRSLAVFLCAALMAGLALAATFVVRSAETGLRSNLHRLGADILVLPWGTMTEKIEGIRLMSAAIEGWIPDAYMDKIAAVDGVAEVSPQLYLTTLNDSPYSPYPKLFVVAYDPETDFTLTPWLQSGQTETLAVGEAVAGAHIALPEGGREMLLLGTPLKMVNRLALTKTTIDNTLFVSFETAERMAAWATENGEEGVNIQPGTFSAVMVKVEMDRDPHAVAVDILEHVSGVVPLETPHMFQAERQQMIGVLRTLMSALTAIWVLMVVFMGLVFSIAVNERRFEIGVLRALGFPSPMILKTLLMEGATLAVLGGSTGIILTMAVFIFLSDPLSTVLKLPLQIPSPLGVLSFSLAGQSLALISVTLAAFIPAWRISRQEVAWTMRE